jgi:hypothetical protein
MNIGTLSLNINTDDLNYGAILHSWAFQQFLMRMDNVENTEVIDYIPKNLNDFNGNHPVTSYLKMHRWTSAVKIALSHSSYKKRLALFHQFRDNEMKVSKKKYTRKSIENAKLPYDCLICESDVIWSPGFFHGDFDETFFLALDSMKDKKKIIYSASMANAEFNDNEKKMFRKLVKSPDSISCRETYAVDFVNKNTDRTAVHVIDPVLLLEGRDYNKICSKRLIKEPYLLLYVPINYDGRYQKAAEKYAKEHGLKVVELSYYVWHELSHKVIASAGVGDFISLIRYADVVLTNSFHAACFSMLYNVQFYGFSRKTGRKLEDLCRLFDIMPHYLDVDSFRECADIDYSKVNARMSELRNKSASWLKNALNS